MSSNGKQIFGVNVRRFREARGMTQENLAEAAELDRSYIGGVERGERNPTLTAILQLAKALTVTPASLFQGIGTDASTLDAPGRVTAIATSGGLEIVFRYDRHDAKYFLPQATVPEFNRVVNVLKDGLASANSRANTVADMFLNAVQSWPDANPSDLWTFLVNRTYCDRSNHPKANARLNLEQSWKRTSGWALERVLLSQYAAFLMQNGIAITISNRAEKSALLGGIDDPRIVPDKADVLISYDDRDEKQLLGVIHVKASIAERRTDDVPMSQALINAGYLSVFWTMDVKSFPSERPVNRGEFGDVTVEQVSEKRRGFEEHGHFSACFSYNRNTEPTSVDNAAVARIFTCDFTNPDDPFSQFLIDAAQLRLNR